MGSSGRVRLLVRPAAECLCVDLSARLGGLFQIQPAVREDSDLVDDMDGVVASLTEAGVEFVSCPVNFDLEDTDAVSVVFFYDPDRYVLELMHHKR